MAFNPSWMSEAEGRASAFMNANSGAPRELTPKEKAAANEARIEDLFKSMQNRWGTPQDDMVRQALEDIISGKRTAASTPEKIKAGSAGVPYDTATKAAMFAKGSDMSAAAETAQANRLAETMAQSGMSTFDPAYAAAARELSAQRQGANQRTRQDIDSRASIANQAARAQQVQMQLAADQANAANVRNAEAMNFSAFQNALNQSQNQSNLNRQGQTGVDQWIAQNLMQRQFSNPTITKITQSNAPTTSLLQDWAAQDAADARAKQAPTLKETPQYKPYVPQAPAENKPANNGTAWANPWDTGSFKFGDKEYNASGAPKNDAAMSDFVPNTGGYKAPAWQDPKKAKPQWPAFSAKPTFGV